MFELRGTGDVVRALTSVLGPEFTDKALVSALRVSMKPLYELVRSGAPVRSGRLRNAVALGVNRQAKRRYQGAKNMSVYIRSGKTRDDKKGAWYKFIAHARKPWMIGLLETNAGKITGTLADELLLAVGRITAKYAKRAARGAR